MDVNFLHQDQEEEDEDAISLSDFPLTPGEHDKEELSTFQDLRSSAAGKTDLFEFSSEHNSNMSHAEDIISCGKLVPFKEHDMYSPNSFYDASQNPSPKYNDHKPPIFQRRRSESLSELKSTSRSCSGKTQMKMRNSHSLDYQKLSRNSSMISDSPEIHRNTSSARSSARFEGSMSIKIPKPRWYIMMFGSVKFPPEMDLQDIKNRQVQRTPSASLFPSLEVVKKVPVNRKISWGVLRVLSCRDDASVHVMAPLSCMPTV